MTRARSQFASLGPFESESDIGSVQHAGAATLVPTTGSLEVAGSGTNMWFNHDEFHFVWRKLKGDFILTARGHLLGKGADPHRKFGLLVRTSLEADSAYVDIALHGDGLASLQFRGKPSGNTHEKKFASRNADVLQLERKAGKFTMSVANFGAPFESKRFAEVDLGDEIYVGLFVCSHNSDVVERAAFDNIRLTIPAKDDFRPYHDYIGSNLEVLDTKTGIRSILHRAADSIQAPNWTHDGKALIYNHNGRLVRFDLATNKPATIDTGVATANNNDHVLSFDGRHIGISNHTPDRGGKSTVYTLPVEGGTPQLVTPNGPSYLHGWSPDGKWLVFTGDRDGNLDIYKIPVTGGKEIRLTNSTGVDDGSEFTPDGKWIYFNSSRTGRMQIWRMHADGSGQEQVTHDDFNNWFPHISPDGLQIVILSFLPDVAPGDHPFYRHVYLRLMPINGGEPKIIAYLYGGQGSINVPSWSPDCRHLAFVSNTAEK